MIIWLREWLDRSEIIAFSLFFSTDWFIFLFLLSMKCLLYKKSYKPCESISSDVLVVLF